MGLGLPSITVPRYGKPSVIAFISRTGARRPCSLARQANSPRIASVAFPPWYGGFGISRFNTRAARVHAHLVVAAPLAAEAMELWVGLYG